MADILLSVGMQTGSAVTSEFMSQLNGMVNALNKGDNTVIKLRPVIDSAGLNDLRSQLSSIGEMVEQIRQKDFNINLHLDDSNRAREALGRYQEQVREYVRNVQEAYSIIGQITKSGPIREMGTDANRYITPALEAITQYGDALGKLETRLDKTSSIAGTERIAQDAQKMYAAIQPLIELARDKGVLSFGENDFKLPAMMSEAASSATGLGGILDSLLSSIQNLSNAMTQQGSAASSCAQQAADGLKTQTTAVNEAAQVYRDLMILQQSINSTRTKIAGLDPEKDAERISVLSNQLLHLTQDYNTLYNTFSRQLSTDQLDNLARGFENASAKVDELKAKAEDSSRFRQTKADLDAVASAYRELLALQRNINSTRSQIAGLDPDRDSARIAVLSNHLSRLTQDYNALYDSFSRRLSVDQVDNLTRGFDNASAKIDELNAKTEDATRNMASKLATAGSGEFEKIYEQASKLKEIPQQLSRDLSAAYNELRNLRDPFASDSSKIQSYERLQTLLAGITQQIREKAQAESDAARAEREAVAAERARENNLKSIESLLKNVERAQRNWSSAAYGKSSGDYARLDELRQKLEALKSSIGSMPAGASASLLRQYATEFTNISRSIARANENTRAFGGGLTALHQRFAYMFSLVNIVMTGIREIKKMITTVVDLDTALTQLQVVTGATDNAIKDYGITATQTAQKIGGSTKDLINSATVFARLGYTLEESDILARYTSMLQNVGDIDASTATNAITAIVKAFDIDVSQIGSVMDKIVTVGNNFPISVTQIAEGMNNAASMLSAAGNSFEQSIALLTAANTTTQDISKASTALRTISARIRNVKSELDDLGEVIETAKYEEAIDILTGHGVKLTDNGEFRATYEILKDIADVWNELSSMEQADIAQQLASTRNQNVFYSIIQQFNEAEDAIQAMGNSAGALETAYNKVVNSVQGHINTFKAALNELSLNLFDSALLKDVIDFGTGILKILNNVVSLTNALGGLKSSLTLIAGIVASIKMDSILKAVIRLGSIIPSISSMFQTLSRSVKTFFDMSRSGSTALMDMSRSAEYTLTAARTAVTGITLLAAAVSAITSAFEQARQKRLAYYNDAINSGSKSLSEAESLYELYAAYASAKSAIDDNIGSKAALAEAAKNLAEALGLEYSAVDNLVDSYKDLSKAELGKALAEQRAALVAAQKALVEGAADPGSYNILTGYQYGNRAQLIQSYLPLGYDFKDAESKAQDLITAYDALIARRDELVKSRNTHGIFESAFEEELNQVIEAIEYLRPFIDAMHDAEDAVDEVSAMINNVENDTVEAIDHVSDVSHKQISSAIQDLTSLSDELKEATEALEAYNNATQSEKGDTADKYVSAYKGFIEDWESGKTGSNKVRAAVELFVPDEVLQGLDYDLTKAGELLASDMYKAIFNTDGDPGANFANYVRENYESIFKDVATITDNGDGTFNFAYESLSGLAEACGLSESAVSALLDSLDKYGVQVMMSKEDTKKLAEELNLIGPNANKAATNVERVMTAISGLAKEGKSKTEIKGLLDSLESAGYIDLTGIEGIGEAISAAVDAVGELDEEKATMEITVEDRATQVINSVLATLHAANGQTATLYVKAQSSGGTSSAGLSTEFRSRAAGGSVKSGGKTLVNELGPEIISEDGKAYVAGGGKPTVVNLKQDAIVLDAETSKRAMRGGAFKGIPIRAAAKSLSADMSSGKHTITQREIDTYLKAQVASDNITQAQATEIRDSRISTNAALAAALAAAVNVAKANNAPDSATVPTGSGNGDSGGGGQGGGGQGGGGSGSSSSSKEETWFEKELAEHKHLVAMDKESQQDYLNWLDDAYKRAYNEGIIDLKEYRSKEEEIYRGRHDDFKDHISDTEHLIEMEKNGKNDPTVIFNLYQQMMNDIQAELNKCYADGLDSTNEYVQYLQNAWYKYSEAIKDQQDDATKDAKQQVKDLVDYRIKMLKQYLKNEIDDYKKRISYLKDFYDKQKELLQDAYDEEEYLDEQAEKRKSVTDIQNELEQLAFDDSAWAQKRKKKLMEELAESEKELGKFEKQHALELAQDELDKAYEAQVEELEAKIEELEAKLNNPQLLYEQALDDVRNNSVALYEEMIAYNNSYGLTYRPEYKVTCTTITTHICWDTPKALP